MKITRIKIKNLFGIKEYDSDGKNIELQGKNGVGKSAIIDAIKLALSNKSDRDYVIRKGEDEGEVLIETDTGMSIDRRFRTNKADYTRIRQEGEKADKTEAFVRQFFTELQLNPIEFAHMPAQEQNRIILDLIDFKWDMNWIKDQFGEIPPDVDYSQNILCVLHNIQDKEGYYFKLREETNRDIRNKKAIVEDIGKDLPDNYNADHWQKVELGDLYRKIEKIRHSNDQIEKAKRAVESRDGKVRQFQADRDIELNAIASETTATRNRLEKDIQALEAQIKAHRTELSNLEEKKLDKGAVVIKTYEANVAELEGEVKEHEPLAKLETTPYQELQEEADNAEKMKGHINEYTRMVDLQEEIKVLIDKSEDLTAKIEKARELPGVILENSNIPVEGLSIKDGIPLINGLPVSNLSEGEKFELCISIATRKSESLQLVLLDGIERLAKDKRDKVYGDLKKKGVQFIASRTTDADELQIVRL